MRILYPFLTTGPTNMPVHFYLKSFCGELFFSNRTFFIFGFFFIQNQMRSCYSEKLLRTLVIYIYIFPLGFIYGTYLGPLYQ